MSRSCLNPRYSVTDELKQDRTSLAALLLFLIVALFRRHYLYIFPAGLLGCLLAGVLNGAGSILYYQSLSHLSASVGQLIYSIYALFVALWLLLDNQPPSLLTILRMGMALVAIVLLTTQNISSADMAGVLLMIGASALYALHIPINQRVLYEIPAHTVTLYTLIAMSVVVVPAYLLFDRSVPQPHSNYCPLIGLTLVTFFPRLTLFKIMGGSGETYQYLTETYATGEVSNVSTVTVTGNAAANWATGAPDLNAGDKFIINSDHSTAVEPDTNWATISSMDSDTQLTLTAAYTGAGTSGAYKIRRVYSCPSGERWQYASVNGKFCFVNGNVYAQYWNGTDTYATTLNTTYCNQVRYCTAYANRLITADMYYADDASRNVASAVVKGRRPDRLD